MAWLPTGLTAIVVCDHGSVKPTGVRVSLVGAATFLRPPLKSEPQQCRSSTVTPGSSNASNVAVSGRREQRERRSAAAPCSTASTASAIHTGLRCEALSGIPNDHGLLDHVVRAPEKRRRNGETERLGGLEIDHEFELGRLLDGQVRGFGAFENLVDI